MGGRKWFVTGIMESTGSLYDSEIWTKQSQIGALFGKPTYTTFALRADPNFRKDQRESFLEAKRKKAQETYEKAQADRAADPKLPKPTLEIIKTPTSDDAWGAEMLRDFFANEYTRARLDRKSTRLNSSHIPLSRMPSSA